jgi:large subunit ribosomal protein L5
MSYVPSLKKLYLEQVTPELVKLHSYKNKHEVPRLVKISINTGIDADADKNQIADIQRDVAQIAGQKPVLAKSRKAIANFKLKQGQVVGCM